jgi:hypothetical protein
MFVPLMKTKTNNSHFDEILGCWGIEVLKFRGNGREHLTGDGDKKSTIPPFHHSIIPK